MFQKIRNMRYIYFGNNLGLSSAFNSVLKNKENHFSNNDFIIFFDQDSRIGNNYIKELISEYNKLEDLGLNIGCLGPIYFNTSSKKTEIPKNRKWLDNTSYEVKSIITSSLLCRYKNLKLIDFWNQEIFLDMADWDLCWRLIHKKLICCMTETVKLYHSLGIGEKKIGPFHIKYGKPVREYYQTRDCLFLLTKNYVPLKFKIRFWGMITIRPIIHLMFLDHPKERGSYIRRGFIDYLNCKHGQIYS